MGGMPKTLPAQTDSSPLAVIPLGHPNSMAPDEAVALAVRLKALADPVRLQLLGHLLDQPDLEACTCNLAPVVGLSEPTVSHHLRVLAEAGLLNRESRGTWAWYSVNADRMAELAALLR